MATYVYNFTAVNANLSAWQEIPLDSSPGNYAQPTLGDQAISFSVTMNGNAGTNKLQVAWVEGTNSTTNVGVTQTEDITLSATARRTNLANSASGDYVASASCSSTSNNTMRVVGIGKITKDNRTSPAVDLSGSSRRLYLGVLALDASVTSVTVYVTTSRII